MGVVAENLLGPTGGPVHYSRIPVHEELSEAD